MFEPWPIAFDAVVARHDHARYHYACVYLPEARVPAPGGEGRPRFEGEIGGRPWRGGARSRPAAAARF